MTEPSPNKPTRSPAHLMPRGPAAARRTPTPTPTATPAPAVVPPRAPTPSSSPVAQPPRATRPRPRYHPDAKLSLLAVLGVAWASLFFMMLILSALRGDAPQLPEVRPPLWHAVLDYLILPLGWSAPIAATVLGLLAIGQIQKSDGTKYGLSLAVFDALLFPLLLLDFVVVWLCRQGAAALIQQDVMSPALADTILGQVIPILVIILGDYYLATRAWAAVQPEPP